MGTLFFKMLITHLLALGYDKIIFDTSLKNTRPQYVYEKLGFRKLRIRYCWQNQAGELQSCVNRRPNFVRLSLNIAPASAGILFLSPENSRKNQDYSFIRFSRKRDFSNPRICVILICTNEYAPVAQLDRALDSDSKGHAFESHRAYHTCGAQIAHRSFL